AGGGVGRGGRHAGGRADVHVDGGGRLGAGGEERGPEPRVDRRQGQGGRGLAEAHRVDAPLRVAAHLGGGQVGVPQRHDDQRDEPAGVVAAPIVDHPVVVGPHAGQAEVVVLGLGEGLAAEAGEGGEAERGLDVVELV